MDISIQGVTSVELSHSDGNILFSVVSNVYFSLCSLHHFTTEKDLHLTDLCWIVWKIKKRCLFSSSNVICCLWPTMVSLITDADHSTSTVAVAAAEPRTGLSNVNMVHSPALSLSYSLLLNPAELGSPLNIQQIIKGLQHCNINLTVAHYFCTCV